MANQTSWMALSLLTAGALALPVKAAAADPQQAMVVVRDATTGQLRAATPAEVKILRAQETQLGLVAKPDTALVVRPDGTVHKHLGDAAMVYEVALPDADGKLGMQCIQGEDAAKAALVAPAPAAKSTEEHSHETR